MAFAQLTYRESLLDIAACLRAVQPRFHHMGIRARVARSTLADANESRDWRIHADFAQSLIRAARALCVDEPFALDLDSTVYALDATIIELCLSCFPWARYRRHDGAVTLHAQLDLRGAIPTVVQITEGERADVTFLDNLSLEAGAIYIIDRGSVDFARLYRFTAEAAFFVTRTTRGIRLRRRVSHRVDFQTGVQADQTVALATATARRDHPAPLRRIHDVDPESEKRVVFLTNNFVLPAHTSAGLYRSRWQVEVYFKWIKQHWRIKAFYGTRGNAVKAQIWIALSVYVLVTIIRKRLALPVTLHTLLQVLSLTRLDRPPTVWVVSERTGTLETLDAGNQWELVDL